MEGIQEQGVSGRNKEEFYRARGRWNERISVFLYKRIDYTRTKLVAKREEPRTPSPPCFRIYFDIDRNFTLPRRERKEIGLKNRSNRVSKLSSAYCSRDCENGGRRGAGKL